MTEAAQDREQRLRESYRKHAALAQLSSWLHRHDQAGGASAHFIKTSAVHLQSDGAIAIDAEIDCFNVSGQVMKSSAHCHAVMRATDGVLPKIADVRIAEGTRQRAESFRSAQAENRIRSLIHYFMALVESPGRDPQPFRELLAQRFSLNLIEPPIESFEALSAWVAGPLSCVVASTHVISDLALAKLGDNDYSTTVGMRSEALFPDGSGIASRTTQTWTVADDTQERFARVRQIAIRRDEAHRF
jgi:hypothetical protein